MTQTFSISKSGSTLVARVHTIIEGSDPSTSDEIYTVKKPYGINPVPAGYCSTQNNYRAVGAPTRGVVIQASYGGSVVDDYHSSKGNSSKGIVDELYVPAAALP